MLRSVHIQIPKPCHENWDNMTPDEQGRFCGSCKKIVVDFTVMSDKELLNYISNVAGQHTCGRFSNHQLNTDIITTKSKKRFSWAYVWNVLLASLLATESYAQGEPVVKKKPETHLPDVSPTVGTFAVKERDTVPNKMVQGVVLQSKTNAPLPYAYITVKGTSKGTVCNEKGEFRISVEDKDSVMLEFASVGYNTQTLAINKNSYMLKIMMEPSVMELQGDFVVAYHFTFKQKVKRFFRRTFVAPFKKS